MLEIGSFPSHQLIIDKLKQRWQPHEDGVCRGVAMAAIEAILVDKLKIFSDTLQMIKKK